MRDNLALTIPDPPAITFAGTLTNGTWQGTVATRTNWLYTLQRTTDFISWTAPDSGWGNGAVIALTDTNPPAPAGAYRISADRP